MANAEVDLVGLFWDHFPRNYLQRAVKTLFDCYEAADHYCSSHFERAEATNLRPFYRRALIEGQLRELASAFPLVEAEARRSPAGPWNHTLVIAGRVALTQNAVGDPNEIVRPSLFRQMYAARDNQKYLFPEMQLDEPGPDSVLYGILIHGRSDDSHIFPGFAKIVFPKEDLQSYWPGEIDLFEEFAEVVRSCTEGAFEDGTGEERVAEPTPELRTDIRQIGDGA